MESTAPSLVLPWPAEVFLSSGVHSTCLLVGRMRASGCAGAWIQERETETLCCMGERIRSREKQVSREMGGKGLRVTGCPPFTWHSALALVSVSPEAGPQGRFGGMWLIWEGSPGSYSRRIQSSQPIKSSLASKAPCLRALRHHTVSSLPGSRELSCHPGSCLAFTASASAQLREPGSGLAPGVVGRVTLGPGSPHHTCTVSLGPPLSSKAGGLASVAMDSREEPRQPAWNVSWLWRRGHQEQCDCGAPQASWGQPGSHLHPLPCSPAGAHPPQAPLLSPCPSMALSQGSQALLLPAAHGTGCPWLCYPSPSTA